MRDDNVGAVHLTVLSTMPGRLRLQLEKPIEGEAIFLSIPGLQSCRYNPRIQTMLCCYDKAVISESDLLVRIGALYARLQQTAVLHRQALGGRRLLDGAQRLSGAWLHCP